MQTAKEALLALLKGEKADFIPEVYSSMKDVVFPGERYIELGDKFDPYGTGPDAGALCGRTRDRTRWWTAIWSPRISVSLRLWRSGKTR